MLLCQFFFYQPWSFQNNHFYSRYRSDCHFSYKRIVYADIWSLKGIAEIPPSYIRIGNWWHKERWWSKKVSEGHQHSCSNTWPIIRSFTGEKMAFLLHVSIEKQFFVILCFLSLSFLIEKKNHWPNFCLKNELNFH